ncbi:MAG: hypothetical protein AAB922_02365 [Patescibacteria group bacterium]
MKQFTTIKVGHTAGVYGCSGEYFPLIYTNGSKHGSIHFYGMYGPEGRVSEAMKQKGYKEFYTSSRYGRMVRDDTRGFYIKRGFKQSKEEQAKEAKAHEKLSVVVITW